jgi:hypothetical protein
MRLSVFLISSSGWLETLWTGGQDSVSLASESDIFISWKTLKTPLCICLSFLNFCHSSISVNPQFFHRSKKTSNEAMLALGSCTVEYTHLYICAICTLSCSAWPKPILRFLQLPQLLFKNCTSFAKCFM